MRNRTFDPSPFLNAIDGDRTTFLEFGQQFLAMLPDSLAALAEAAAAGDAEALRDRAHSLKGSLALFHAERLVHELETVEQACRMAPATIGSAVLHTLEEESRAFRDEFDEFCARMAGDALARSHMFNRVEGVRQ